MIIRQAWINRIEELWAQRSIVWLSGVRRVGKTCLAKQLGTARYFNCDLPSVRRQLQYPEFFLSQVKNGSTVIFDEIHRLEDPSLLLKIAADEYPLIRILATGSSTLQATRKFSDTLTDRKRTLHLQPVLWQECQGNFDVQELDRRLLHGGLPEQLLSPELTPEFFEDWIDGFYARDVQELFGIRNRTGFLKLLHLICLRNSGQLDVSDLAKKCGLSRPTVMSHLDAMEISHALTRIPPFHGGGHREIVRQPRIYAFDTGLVAYVKGWDSIRESDRGLLWENLVLDELRFSFLARSIHYWRDKSNHEIDFVIEKPGKRIDAIEAKISPDSFNPKGLLAFRKLHPDGFNYIASPFVKESYTIRKANLMITVCRPDQILLD
jgi:uncharacterized protein